MAWDKTHILKKRLEDDIEYVGGKPFYQGRHVISRDTAVDGGVYLGQGSREAIVVDTKKYPEHFKELYKKARKEASDGKHVDKNRILRAVYNAVKGAMKYDDASVEEIISKYGVENDGKISLNIFLHEGVGICRHQALACAALLERFKKYGHISGKPSVDRNSLCNGGHAWCRYTNSFGNVYILDVAQNYIGRLEDVEKWDYRRPGEAKAKC